MAPDTATQIKMYRQMALIREFELAAMDLFKRGQIKGAVHPSIGQEASAVGVCMALDHDDLIVGTHRSHGHNLAKGASPERMMAEILGKDTGYCKGRGGSMHIAAFDTGSLGALGVVGAGNPLAVGAALAFQMRGERRVAVPFTGDAGTNTGSWHESLNMASVWNLPVVFVLEDNKYGVSTHIRDSTNIDDLSIRAQSYGIPGVLVNGFDVLAVYEAATEAVARARAGKGPTLLVAEAYRFEGHYAGEPEVYRERSEVAEHRKHDPLTHFRRVLVDTGVASSEELDDVDSAAKDEISAAIEFAKASPDPDPSTAMDYIYA
ncbi:MAG: thiamine pyrophosphate-dependent dehydrogenase E1 component subunit alpha [Acidimicrobiia bacterium]|nr:thiamine pyrophosphate-dependent dehydrogenase E1 component subunit alpha [Acidimicrobiia bacterium]